MAQASTPNKTRPISPHLQIWRWGPAMLTSILHRVSGDGMAIVGLAVLVFWLHALTGGEAAYAAFSVHASAWYGRLVLVGLTWAFFNHAASGIRHLVMDIGAGYELKTNNLWSVLTPLIGIGLTVAVWLPILLHHSN